MDASAFCKAILLLVACGVMSPCIAGSATVLEVQQTRFVVNGRPTFLLGLSYYAGLGAREEFVQADLDDMQRSGFNWLRVFATLAVLGADVSAVDEYGAARQPQLSRLKWLVAECDRRGLIVDVTLARCSGDGGGIRSLAAHRSAVETLVGALRGHRNWYLDLANERDLREAPYVSPEELRTLRDVARQLDPQLLVTASFCDRDLRKDEMRDILLTVGLDFLSPHLPRYVGAPRETEGWTRAALAFLATIDRTVPIHFQEPFRRGHDPWEPVAEDFLTDLRGAITGGAAGWCLHNGTQRNAADQEPRRSFDLRARRLFDQLDEEELKVAAQARQLVDGLLPQPVE
jgi:hypothetical protein